ncbi:amidohydrolase family protein [Rufibacter quisquiliarum]|uniref:Imidazolonepropionase-like amidohydrolase n=1 Tax=Rufibacter quisquiliarum TaxID=1549639 RepID=A0A839GCY5_9BACT|nr:amidohydrolase family protein [Rufibacter quisquiliarum]MBA9076250.1 imidazolonepropionase-like amidohydrolase [Rufibacter quisquiliarum]
MKKIVLSVLAVAALSLQGRAQETYPRNGVYDERTGLRAFTNATIYVDYQTKLENATLVIKDGKVAAVGTKVSIPRGAMVTDLKGKTIYPGFVDPYSNYGLPAVSRQAVSYGSPPQAESKKEGAYNWNQAIRPETNAVELFKVDNKAADDLRKLGYGAVLSVHQDGIARGTAALVSLANKRENQVILLDKAASALSFDRGSSTQEYPNSLMGAIALLRQTYLDAQWNLQNPDKEQNLSLKAFTEANRLPQIFEVSNKLNAVRADKVGDEFGYQYIFKGNGDEYQMLPEIKNTKAPFILSLNFPDPYNVEDPYETRRIELDDLKHWEMAPANAAILAKEGVTIAFTSADLRDKSKFLANLRKAVQHGLPEPEALKALTLTPARLVKAEKYVGSLQEGRQANFVVTSGSLFEPTTLLLTNWVQGQEYRISETPADFRGVYTLKIGSQPDRKLIISGTPEKPDLKVVAPDTIKGSLTMSGEMLTFAFAPAKNSKENIRLTGWYTGKSFQGEAQLPDAQMVKWTALLSEAATQQAKRDSARTKASDPVQLGSMVYPFAAFGRTALPKAETVLIKNATVWTNEKEGKLENADVLLRDGKIAQVGKNLNASGAKVIDGTGKHVTPGIIDEHSHIALDGVNEGTQAVTAEVRMSDVVNHEQVNIYRQLAGGVTTSQLLHGSANPIGGQSAIIKLRWGQAPEKLMFEGADPFIKFALGENVKHSNRSPVYNVRFPQTRMGVEQVMVDAFQRAKEYQKAWGDYHQLSKSKKAKTAAPRRDLELEALVEILNDKRFITCHSYVQSEINMLMKVADQMGFRVNTFTHILEGYKVADKMKARNIGASTFSDWWAYKMEVKDAIPYNAAIMHNVGVTTAINSDDAEMARRLNQEAAKTIKYGGVSEEDALKMVTLNPAKLLHLDNRVGSLKPGKDADVVIWNEHPLSIYARPEKTFVDGIAYFDLETDKALQEAQEKERLRLINKMLAAKAKGEKTQSAPSGRRFGQVLHCEDVDNGAEEVLYESEYGQK